MPRQSFGPYTLSISATDALLNWRGAKGEACYIRWVTGADLPLHVQEVLLEHVGQQLLQVSPEEPWLLHLAWSLGWAYAASDQRLGGPVEPPQLP